MTTTLRITTDHITRTDYDIPIPDPTHLSHILHGTPASSRELTDYVKDHLPDWADIAEVFLTETTTEIVNTEIVKDTE